MTQTPKSKGEDAHTGSPNQPTAPSKAVSRDEVRLGYVSGIFGVRGEVRLFLDNPNSVLLDAAQVVSLRSPAGGPPQTDRVVKLKARSGAGKRIIGCIAGVGGREEARGLQGLEIWIDRARLPELADGEWYLQDLIGLAVQTESGEMLGTIREIHQSSSRDFWEVMGPSGRRFVPVTSEVVQKVEIGVGVVIADGLDLVVE